MTSHCVAASFHHIDFNMRKTFTRNGKIFHVSIFDRIDSTSSRRKDETFAKQLSKE